jgi:hypothetical protein
MTSKSKRERRHGRADRLEESKHLGRLQQLLFDRNSRRRLPGQRALDQALAPLTAEELFWYCETRSSGPLYLLPTREFVKGLAKLVKGLAGPAGTVLEVAAGDGFLTRSLHPAAPALRWLASDSGAWEAPGARMSAAERRRETGRIEGVRLGLGVERRDAVASICAHRPEVVIACWLPPGKLFERILRAPCRFVIELGSGGGVTGQGEWGWRFAHEFAPPAIEKLARSRLDAGGSRRTQLTIYYGRRHPEYREERPRSGTWLSQFKPAPKARSKK